VSNRSRPRTFDLPSGWTRERLMYLGIGGLIILIIILVLLFR
jgi:hypothetical protein